MRKEKTQTVLHVSSIVKGLRSITYVASHSHRSQVANGARHSHGEDNMSHLEPSVLFRDSEENMYDREPDGACHLSAYQPSAHLATRSDVDP